MSAPPHDVVRVRLEPGSWVGWVFAGVAGVGAVVALSMSLSMTGSGPAALCGPQCLDRPIAVLLSGQPPAPAAVDKARVLVRRQLAASPFDASAWLRLGLIETLSGDGRLGAEGVRALEASYRYAPVDVDVARWRLTFVFEHWREASPTVRKAAEREVRVLFAAPQNRPGMRRWARIIGDRSGRLAAGLMIAQLDAGF